MENEEVSKAFHGLAPNHGAVFLFLQNHAVRCSADFRF